MDKLVVEYVSVDELTPYALNAKKHPRRQIDQIKRSIADYGMIDPIGIWRGEIVEGHGRLQACKELGYTTVPIIRLDHLTDEQRREYTIVHNQTTLNSGYDWEVMESELRSLPDFDAEFFGIEARRMKEDDGLRSHLHHNVFENQEREQYDTGNYFGIPELTATQTYGTNFLRFCETTDSWIWHSLNVCMMRQFSRDSIRGAETRRAQRP